MSNSCADDFGGYGATAIDSLSTAIIFGKEDVVLQILEYIATLDWKVVKDGSRIQLFEVTIRHFAAMISAWDLLNGPFSSMAQDATLRQQLYDRMVELGDALSCAFDTPSGVPRDWIDPAACESDRGTTNTIASAGTLILEFGRLSDITNDRKYVQLAQRAENFLLKPKPASGEPFPALLGSFIYVQDGSIADTSGSWGAFADCKAASALLSFASSKVSSADYVTQLSTNTFLKLTSTTASSTASISTAGSSPPTPR